MGVPEGLRDALADRCVLERTTVLASREVAITLTAP